MSRLEGWEREYRQWKADDMPQPSCASINAVQDYLRTIPAGPERDRAIAELETVRDLNLALRLLAKQAMRFALMHLDRKSH